ncbi:SDR family NAD(P)-dependent oxidoreductase [Rufibacter sp. LB8]|uniref:SDR family NAD(P)-dependent oxidoreductase n=1 Tax=Rufibacter sp. LB8 TaxID=2777781 RepID=UPI00178C24F6|nr:SDR family oxidoreductase [Rufibacter sp. LB8]
MKNYLIIGGSSGIGQALTQLLAAEGHRVFGTYFQNEPQTGSAGVTFHPLDVLADTLDLSFLPETLDGVAYCPGSVNLLPFARIKPEAFVQDFQLQVGGAIKVLQAVLPRLKAAGFASVVFFSTVAVQTGFTFHAQVAASKGAIEGLTRALAAELAPTIRVNAVAPSITDTPLAAKFLNTEDKKQANAQRHPLKKIGSPEDVASAALFLLTDKSSWMTGQILAIDGGMSSIR